VYVANQTAGTISIVDTSTHQISALDRMTDARSVALSSDGTRLFVVSSHPRGIPSALDMVELPGGAVRDIPVAAEADGIALDPGGQYAWLAHLDGRLTRIELALPWAKETVHLG
jgi:DNA-binding beta-propeller fold protein YncE